MARMVRSATWSRERTNAASRSRAEIGGKRTPSIHRRRVRLLTPTDVRGLLAAHDLRPSRALGQNFLADPNTARRIVRLAGVGPGDRVLEVGPGIGSLTVALADGRRAYWSEEL